jgi:hypothetical protein
LTSTLGWLRRSLVSDPHLWIAFAAAFLFLLSDVLGLLGVELPFKRPEEGLLIVLTICILTLVGDRLKEGEQVHHDSEKLAAIAGSVFGKGVMLRRRPTTREEYDYLWGGYTGRYHVYNPSYKVDTNTGEDEIAKILTRRYQDPQFERARYLFLTKDDAGKADLKTFRHLMGLVKQACPHVVNKIEVKELKHMDASSVPEIYLGTRFGMPICVMELKEPAVRPQHGVPHYYLVMHDPEAIEHYRLNHFESVWNAPEAEPVHLWS